jgi:hypothetical protein
VSAGSQGQASHKYSSRDGYVVGLASLHARGVEYRWDVQYIDGHKSHPLSIIQEWGLAICQKEIYNDALTYYSTRWLVPLKQPAKMVAN